MNQSNLQDLYSQHRGKVSDKWSIYLETYDDIFSSYRNENIRLLEIGVQNGGSLEIWSDYFPRAELFAGVDIDEACRLLRYKDSRIKLVIGNANTDHTQAEILHVSTEFDIILDDGSHTSSDIVSSFARYFPCLRDGGLYVAEDLHCSYWEAFQGGIFRPDSSMSFFKRLADIVNFEHWAVSGQRSDILRTFAQKYNCTLSESSLERIYSVEFRNSVCIIRKRPAEQVSLGPRVVVGTDAVVDDAPLTLEKSKACRAQESGNEWSNLRRLPEVELTELRAERSVLKEELQSLQFEQQALKDSLEALRDSKQKLRIEYEALGTEYARQSAAHANVLQSLKSDLVAIQERYTRLESVLQCRDETLAAVYASRAWRVAMMASDFARRFPRLSEFAWKAVKLIKQGR